jgi:hypothetical protein
MPLAHMVGYISILKSLHEDLQQLRLYMAEVQSSLQEGQDFLDKAEALSKTLDIRMKTGSRDHEALLNFFEDLGKSPDQAL